MLFPPTLNRVKIFTSTRTLTPVSAAGYRVEAHDDPIEQQIDRWVTASQALISGVGPVNIVRMSQVEGTVLETITLPVLFALPMEQLYGKEESCP